MHFFKAIVMDMDTAIHDIKESKLKEEEYSGSKAKRAPEINTLNEMRHRFGAIDLQSTTQVSNSINANGLPSKYSGHRVE